MSKTRLTVFILALMLISVPFSLCARHFARWYTTMGNFTADLRDEIVPITAGNFIDLTESGFYDGLHFHRVVSNFVIQDGDPLGTGYGGPGYTIPDEFSPLLNHDRAGVLAMAHTNQPNSAGSQYYITLRSTPNLDGFYAVFGRVFEGLDVVMAIGQVPVDANDHPITNVVIDSLKILDQVINSITPADTVTTYDSLNPYSFVVEAYNDDFTVQFAWYINDVLQQGQTDFIFEPSFTTIGANTVKCVSTTTDISWTTLWHVDVQSVQTQDNNNAPPSGLSFILQPNPFKKNVKVICSSKNSSPLSLNIFDGKGRKLRSQTLTASDSHSLTWQWDGTDDQGTSLPSGVYYIRLNSGTESRIQKCVLLK